MQGIRALAAWLRQVMNVSYIQNMPEAIRRETLRCWPLRNTGGLTVLVILRVGLQLGRSASPNSLPVDVQSRRSAAVG